MKEKLILIGAGQHARVVLYNLREQAKYEIIGMITAEISKVGSTIDGVKVLGTDVDRDKIKAEYGVSKFFLGLGNIKTREYLFNLYTSEGWRSVNIIHPNAIVSREAKIGTGVLIEAGCLVTPNPVIGNNVVINTGSQVNHDNIIGDHVYIASGVILSGGVVIEERTLIDDGAVVTIGRSIGTNCIIGAGSIVTKDIESNVVAYGNPCKIIRRNV